MALMDPRPFGEITSSLATELFETWDGDVLIAQPKGTKKGRVYLDRRQVIELVEELNIWLEARK